MGNSQYSKGAVKVLRDGLDGVRKAILAAGIGGGGEGSGEIAMEIITRLENLEAAVAGINEKLHVVTGEKDETSKIDTLPEIIAFLANQTNDKRLENATEGILDENGIIHYS